MKVTLYEALGIAPNASQEEVRTALRDLVRQYYVSTRQEQVEIEEALRFINHASHVLNDPQRRARYDQEMASGAHINDGGRRRDYVATTTALGVGRTITRLPEAQSMRAHSDEFTQDGELTDATASELTSNAIKSLPQEPQHFGLAANFANVRSNLSGQVIFGVFLLPVLLVFLWAVTPTMGLIYQVRLLLFWTTVLLLVAAGVYAMVHVLAPRRRAAPAPASALPLALAQVTILKWRQEKTVFLGTNQPLEDQTWLFRLRMAELERAKNRRTSEARPWLRFWARLFDYGLWGLILGAMVRALVGSGWLSSDAAALLTHPLLAPTLITLTWIPVETALQVYWRTTPGKWLFAIFVQYGVSNVYASDDIRSRWRTCSRRAIRLWVRGVACGLPLIMLGAMALSKEALQKRHETTWDAMEDCLVTNGEIGSVNAVTSTLALMAFVWLYGNAWADPLRATTNNIDAVIARGSYWLDAAHKALKTLSRHPEKDITAVAQVDDGAPSPLELKRRRWTAMSAEADRLAAASKYREAVRLCSTWADEDYNNARAWRCLGLAHEALGEHQPAVEALQRAARLDPADASVQEALIRSFRAQYRR